MALLTQNVANGGCEWPLSLFFFKKKGKLSNGDGSAAVQQQKCKLHIAFHGCEQGFDTIGQVFVEYVRVEKTGIRT